MQTLIKEPPPIRSLAELLAVATRVADDAIAHYEAQALRVRQAGADALAATYEELAGQQRAQAGRALVRISAVADASVPALVIARVLDDEETAFAAAELLDPYRIFAVAVRNGERAFAFWAYVVAHAPSADVMQAAEYLAREELARAAWLRRRRREAYHALRRCVDRHPAVPEALEGQLAVLLAERSASVHDDVERSQLALFARYANERGSWLARAPFDPDLPSLKHPPFVPAAAWNDALALSETLLDRYLEIAGEGRNEAARDRAQAFAGELIACLRFLRNG